MDARRWTWADPLRSRRIVSTAAVIAVVMGIVTILKTLDVILKPLAVAFFFYYAGEPLKRRLSRWNVPTWLSNLAIVVIGVALIAAFAEVFNLYRDELSDLVPQMLHRAQVGLRSLFGWSRRLPMVGAPIHKAGVDGNLPVESVGKAAGAIFGGMLDFISGGLLVIVYLIFIDYEAQRLPRRLRKAFGSERADVIVDVAGRINESIVRYLFVKSVISILAALLSVGIFLLFGVDLPVLWGLLTFIGNFIPYIGPIVAFAFPVIFSLAAGASWGHVLLMAGLLVLVQGAIDNLLQPKLTGDKLNLSPLLTILAIPLWGWIWGPLGVVLSIPLTVALRIVFDHIPATQALAALMGEEGDTPSKPGGREVAPIVKAAVK